MNEYCNFFGYKCLHHQLVANSQGLNRKAKNMNLEAEATALKNKAMTLETKDWTFDT